MSDEPNTVSAWAVAFSGPSQDEWDAFFAWTETPEGRVFIQAMHDGKTDFRSQNPEEWT